MTTLSINDDTAPKTTILQFPQGFLAPALSHLHPGHGRMANNKLDLPHPVALIIVTKHAAIIQNHFDKDRLSFIQLF